MPESDDDMVFKLGQRVRHPIFGAGIVTEVDMNKSAHIVLFDCMDTPRSISFRAKLEKM